MGRFLRYTESMRRLWQRFHSWFLRGEPVLVAEVFDGRIRVSRALAELARKRLSVFESRVRELSSYEVTHVMASLGRLLRSFGKPPPALIMCADPTFVTTLHSAVSLIREKPREPIDEADFGNLVGQALWKIFSRSRSRAAAKMGIGDIDVVLADVRVKQIRLDGHRVVNPIGFPAKAVEFQVVETMSTRPFLDGLREAVRSPSAVTLLENGALYADLLARAHGTDAFLLANVFRGRTDLFARDGVSLAFRDSFPWGEEHIIRAVKEECGVGEDAARGLIGRYARGEASPRFLRRFEQVLKGELQLFLNGVSTQLGAMASRTVYVNAFFPIPAFLFESGFGRRLHRRARIVPVHGDAVCAAFGFTLRSGKGMAGLQNGFATLAPLLDLSFLPHHDRIIESMVLRHTRWLGGAS